MKAIKIDSPGNASVHSSAPRPTPAPGDVLIRINAVGLNPTDWKNVDAATEDELWKNRTIGCDFAGVIEDANGNTTLTAGQRVSGMVNSRHPENVAGVGSFAEYANVPAELVFPTPQSLSDTDAATLGVGVLTVGQTLYQTLRLPFPSEVTEPSNRWILVYGASTATGTLAVQYARLSGFRVAATCSPRNFDLIKSLGAEVVEDYSDADCGRKINEQTGNSMLYALDCIGDERSVKVSESALASEGNSLYSTIIPTKLTRDNVKYYWTMAYTAFGSPVPVGPGKELPAKPEDREFAVKWIAEAMKWLDQGKVKVHPPDVRGGGLEGVLEGLEELKAGKVSGKKLVYTL